MKNEPPPRGDALYFLHGWMDRDADLSVQHHDVTGAEFAPLSPLGLAVHGEAGGCGWRQAASNRGQSTPLAAPFIFGPDNKYDPRTYAIRRGLGGWVTGATELVHMGQGVIGLGGGIDYFMTTVFNYPTLAECYKVAALDAWNKLMQ